MGPEELKPEPIDRNSTGLRWPLGVELAERLGRSRFSSYDFA